MEWLGEIMAARLFMGKPCIGAHRCASCGAEQRATEPYKRALLDTFTDFDGLLISGGTHLCKSCADILGDHDMRFCPVLYREPGVKEIPDRADILPLLRKPPEKFVLTVPYNYKKHHWLYAGLSTDKLALIGTDTRTVALDYRRYDIPAAINTVEEMISAGIFRREIVSGRYSVYTLSKYPGAEDCEQQIKALRPCGAVELFVQYLPQQKFKVDWERSRRMITKSETMAAQLLCNIAYESKMRRSEGLRFWGGFYGRKIDRYKSLPLHDFVSRLAVSIGSVVDVDYIRVIPADQEELTMQEIRDKTSLILSLAYDIRKDVM